MGIVFRRVKRKIISADPQRQAILSRLRAVYRHLPRNGALIFFGVKPVAIKAYGGYCWTRDKRPVLARKQKTRGRFYLLLAYDVRSGKAHWAFIKVILIL
jgi:hypothetical protein